MPDREAGARPVIDWLVGGGELGALIRATDWSETRFGPRERWSPTLRSVVNLLVSTRFPTALLWGQELLLLYNDAYREIAGERHPRALGRSSREVWPEVWHINEPIFAAVMDRGETLYLEDKLFPIDRRGRLEEAFFTLCYSPVRTEDGAIAGTLVTLLETTSRVRREQALETSRDRAEAAAVREREALRETESRYRALFEEIDIGFCVIQMLFDDAGRATDYQFLETNPAFERHTGLVDAKGRTARQLVPNLEPIWSEKYGRVATTGEPIRFELESRAMGRWFEVYAFRTGVAAEHRIALIFTDITARRRVEEQLRLQESRLRAMFDNVPEGITICDAAGHVQMVSRHGQALLGGPQVGRSIDEVLREWPVYRPDRKEPMPFEELPLVRALRGETVHDVELIEISSTGRELPLSCNAAPIRDEAGQIVAAIVAWRDITDRKRAERELRESEQKFRSVFEQSAIGMGRVRFSDARWIDVNDAFCHMLGRSRAEMLATPWPEITHPDDVDLDLVPFRRMARGEIDSYTVEKRFVHKTGTLVWSRLTLSLVRDAAGLPDYEIAIIEDIAERKRAEEALGASRSLLEAERARLQAIVETLPVGFFVMDARGAMTLVNEAMKRTWAGNPPLHCPVDYSQYKGFWPDTGEPLAAEDWPCAQALQGRRVDGVIVDIERFDGSRATLLVSSAPIRDESGRVVGAVAANQDITALRAAEAKLLEADRRKNEFLAMLSHELRNPLAPIKNSLYILDRAPPGGPQSRRAQDVIGRQVQHMTRLIDDLLDVTRISRGKINLQKERLELCDLVHRTADDHRSLFKAAGIELGVEACAGPLHVEGDPTRLAQAIGNLLGNAVKFTPRGGRVELRLASDGGKASIHVRDTGAGIAPDLLDQLFEPFVQAEATLDRSKGGLGLGLALVKGLVELHGGSVAARSEGAGEGAEFILTLPLEEEEAAAVHGGASTAGNARDALRVLLIEDNVDAAETLKEALELNGHAVEIAATGFAGLDKARAWRPDIVLCDIGLPGIDGFEVARRMRSDPDLRTACLVALSGYAAPEDIEKSREAGFLRHLAKPPDLVTLERTLTEACGAGTRRGGGA